jgi:ankyrin repeat protein
MKATKSCNSTHVEALLRAGADPRLKNADGMTALELADQLGQTRIAQMLKAGAQHDARQDD